MKSLMVIAGEISGDMHAAKVVRAIRAPREGGQARSSDVKFFGIGGDELRAEGMEILVDAKDMAVLGLWEVLKRYGHFKRVFNDMVRVALERKPDAVLLIDYPGFNLRFAEKMHAAGIKVLYYVCPQVWAWHRSRVAQMARIVDHLMVIFPFEVDVFKGTGLKVDFVGHPLVEEAQRAMSEPLQPLPWKGQPQIALLPGSRRQEIERILPPMLGAVPLLKGKFPEASFIVAAASEEMAGLIHSILDSQSSILEVVTGSTRQTLRQARAAMVASGTATLEAAMMECPMIVVYKTAALTYLLGKQLVRVPHLGMVNLIAERELCREFIQGDATPQKLAAAMEDLVRGQKDVSGLREVKAKLGKGGAAERVAEIVLGELSL